MTEMHDWQTIREIIAQEIEQMVIIAFSYDQQRTARLVQETIAGRVRNPREWHA